MKIYHVKTQEDYDALMEELELRGILWIDGTFPTSENCWKIREAETVIRVHGDNIITPGSLIATKREYPDIPIQIYKAKQNDVESAIEIVSQNNAELFHKIIINLEQTYLAKNADYGNSFEQSLDEFGEVAGVVRIGDKFNRAKNLSKNKANVVDESKIDTLFDMATYCIMQAMWLMKREG